MGNDSLVPIAVGGAGLTLGFEIPGLDFFSGDVGRVQGEGVVLPGEGELCESAGLDEDVKEE